MDRLTAKRKHAEALREWEKAIDVTDAARAALHAAEAAEERAKRKVQQALKRMPLPQIVTQGTITRWNSTTRKDSQN